MQLGNQQILNGNINLDQKLTSSPLINWFSKLPDELVVTVIENLTLDSLAQTILVNKKFKGFSEKSTLSLSTISDIQNITHSIYQSCLSGLNKLAFPKEFKKVGNIFSDFIKNLVKVSPGPFICINENIENLDNILKILRTANTYMKGKNKWMERDNDGSVEFYKLLAEYREWEGYSVYLMDNQGILRVYETSERLLDGKPITSKLRCYYHKMETQNKSLVYNSKKNEIECLLKVINKLPNL